MALAHFNGMLQKCAVSSPTQAVSLHIQMATLAHVTSIITTTYCSNPHRIARMKWMPGLKKVGTTFKQKGCSGRCMCTANCAATQAVQDELQKGHEHNSLVELPEESEDLRYLVLAPGVKKAGHCIHREKGNHEDNLERTEFDRGHRCVAGMPGEVNC
mmetsp:Transcript_6967/g.16476  ORF Transcript_6967/g.16476 Transcript_6967/m.16476 type:complete len:158 (+) Transcript_6967:737-1210(+)